MYFTHDVQTALHVADLHQADARAAFPRGRRIRPWWPSRWLGQPAAPARPALTPSAPSRHHGTPSPA